MCIALQDVHRNLKAPLCCMYMYHPESEESREILGFVSVMLISICMVHTFKALLYILSARCINAAFAALIQRHDQLSACAFNPQKLTIGTSETFSHYTTVNFSHIHHHRICKPGIVFV